MTDPYSAEIWVVTNEPSKVSKSFMQAHPGIASTVSQLALHQSERNTLCLLHPHVRFSIEAGMGGGLRNQPSINGLTTRQSPPAPRC